MTTPSTPFPEPEHESPVEADAVAEEDMETADVAERTELAPDEQVNQPERERPQTIADAEYPEDR